MRRPDYLLIMEDFKFPRTMEDNLSMQAIQKVLTTNIISKDFEIEVDFRDIWKTRAIEEGFDKIVGCIETSKTEEQFLATKRMIKNYDRLHEFEKLTEFLQMICHFYERGIQKLVAKGVLTEW